MQLNATMEDDIRHGFLALSARISREAFVASFQDGNDGHGSRAGDGVMARFREFARARARQRKAGARNHVLHTSVSTLADAMKSKCGNLRDLRGAQLL